MLLGAMFTLAGCGDKKDSQNNKSICEELNGLMQEMKEKGMKFTVSSVQAYIEQNSDYCLIGGSNKEYTEKPDSSADKFSVMEKEYNFTMLYENSLVYDTKNDKYYSIIMGVSNDIDGNIPHFSKASEI